MPVRIREGPHQICWIRAIPLCYCPVMKLADTDSRALLARWACVATMLCAASMGVGCGRSASPDPESGSPEGTDLAVPRPAPRRALTDLDQARLIQIVRQSNPIPGGPTVDAWVENRVAHAGGPLLYSDWAIAPGEEGVHTVKFSYTWRTSRFEILKETLAWTVEEDTRVVTGPLEEASNDGTSPEDTQVVAPPSAKPTATATEPPS